MTRATIDYECMVCTAVFAATQPAKYCTAACQQKAQRARNAKVFLRPCAWCGEAFDGSIASLRYCSEEHKREGARAAQRKRRAAANPHWEAACLGCGTTFTTNTRKKKFCGEECRCSWHYLNGEGARRQRIQDWFQTNPNGARLARLEWSQRRRAVKAGSVDSVGVTRRDWERLVRRYDGCCAYCGKRAPLQRDHVVPIARGGRHAIGNLLPACAKCNANKKAKFLMAWKLQQRKRAAA